MVKTLCDTCRGDAVYKLRYDHQGFRGVGQFQAAFDPPHAYSKTEDACEEHMTTQLYALIRAWKNVEVSR